MPPSDLALVFAPGYDFELPAFEGPDAVGNVLEFDGQRASRALARFDASGQEARRLAPRPATRAELESVHTPAYLDRLESPHSRPGEVAEILELPAAARTAPDELEQHYLAPMRLGVGGTLVATAWALGRPRGSAPVAVNLSGGYHHAMADRGSGFCAFNDLALAAVLAQREFSIESVLCIDLDAHQGNGTARLFAELPGARLLDVFDGDIWPQDEVARAVTEHALALPRGTKAAAYLAALETGLDAAFAEPPGLVLYNAGTDVLAGDPLGGFELGLSDVAERDRQVLSRTRAAGIPTITTASGGYSETSHRALAGLLAVAAS
jgi:histone deacetylase 11